MKQDFWNILSLFCSNYCQGLNALPCCDRFLICNVREKIGQNPIETIFIIPLNIRRKDMQCTISYKGFWMIQQSGKFVKILVPFIRFSTFSDNLIGNSVSIFIILGR